MEGSLDPEEVMLWLRDWSENLIKISSSFSQAMFLRKVQREHCDSKQDIQDPPTVH